MVWEEEPLRCRDPRRKLSQESHHHYKSPNSEFLYYISNVMDKHITHFYNIQVHVLYNLLL